jgi:tetratricopeptide (TPR) repeat protein
MTLFIVLLVLIVVTLIILGYTLYKKIPDLKNLNIESLAEEQQEKVRKNMLEAKFSRVSERLKSRMTGISMPKKGFLATRIKEIKKRVVELEDKYKKGQGEMIDTKTTSELFEEAKKMIEADNFSEAERVLIEIIAEDNKNIDAYETLGDLYFDIKSYSQAEEIYKYLIKISIVDTGSTKSIRGSKMDELEADALSSLDVDSKMGLYYEDLGQVYEAMEKDDAALDAYLKATSVEPNNPKYLDKLLDISIKLKDRGLAKKAFYGLKKINPENAKLPDLEKAIEKL